MTTHSNSNNNNLVLKIQVETPGNVERHRKRVGAASLTFAQLHALVGSLLPPSAGHAGVVITYLDGDLDEIRVKDDSDLREALLVKDEKNSDTLRLTVKAVAEAAPPIAAPAPAANCQDGSNSKEKTRPTHGSSSSDRRRGCREWRRWGCQQRPPPASACGFPPLFSGMAGRGFPLPPATMVDFLAANACGGKGKALLEDVLAHSSFAALLRAAADVLETVKSATSAFSIRELGTTLWHLQECQELVQWLKTRAPELAPMLVLLGGLVQPQTPAVPPGNASPGSSKSPATPPQFNFEDLLQHAGNFQQLFGGRPCNSRSDEMPDEDVSLQTAIQSSLRPHSKTAEETATGLKAEAVGAEATNVPAGKEHASSLSNGAALAAVQAPASEVPGQALHEAETLQLQSMGFHDLEAVRAALQSTDGNVQYALSRLLS